MGTVSEDIMYASQQINVPLNLPYILKQYAKAAIKTQPRDLLHWSSAYFRALANGDVPPVKDRIEYPLISTPSGLTAGFLRILIKQFGKSGIVEEKDLIKKWKGVGLEIDELQNMLRLCGFRKTVRWLNFVAVAAGFLSPNLTQTMILICELLTDEPEGGSAAILYQTFMTLYIYLARMDCGPICHLKSNMADTFSEEVSVDDLLGKAEAETEKSSEKLSDIEVALERKPTLDSNDSDKGVMVWEDIAHPDLVQEKTAAADEEKTVDDNTDIADNIPVDVVDEPTTVVDEEEKADDQESVKSTESYDNTGITLKFHDSEQDVKIDDYTGPIDPKLKKRFEKKLEEEQREETDEKTDTDETKENETNDDKDNKEEEIGEENAIKEEERVADDMEKDENKSESKAEEDIERKEEEEEKNGDEVGRKSQIEEKGEDDNKDEEVKEDAREEEEEKKEDAKEEGGEEEVKKETAEEIIKETGRMESSGEGEKTPTKKNKKKKKQAKKEGEDEGEKKEEGEEGGGGGEEEEESDHEEQSRYEYSLELEEEEEETDEKAGDAEEKSVKEELVVGEDVAEKKEVEEEEEVKVAEEVGEEEEVKEEQSADLQSIDSALPLQGQRKSDIVAYGYGCLHLPKHRNLSFTDSLVSEPDNHFWVNVPGIGALVPEKQILSLKAYFLYASEKQNGYVMPRNVKHHLCPSLEPPVVEMEKRSSTDIEWIHDDK